jgi:betaine-aldehyde dehydrogenase
VHEDANTMSRSTDSVQPAASHFVAGKFVDDPHGSPLRSICPVTGNVLARLNTASDELVDSCVSAALAAQESWAALTGAQRGRILCAAARLIRERNRELSILETRDTGKPLQETLCADALSGADCLEYFGGIAATISGESVQLGESFFYTRREPLGLCVGIGAWNYPLQIACWKAAPALACGNSMIFKPSEVTPLSALKLAEILQQAGLPDGVFNVLQGGAATGSALTQHPGVAKVSLTGSVATGRRVALAAAESMKAVTLELGGKSPLIVFADADLDQAVAGAMLGNFYSSGQVCSNGTRVFVQRPILEPFLQRVKGRTEQIRLGDPLDEKIQMGPLVSRSQRDKVLSYIETGKREGARLVCGGSVAVVPGFTEGNFIQPTIFADVTDEMTIAREEIFGPVMSVLTFDTIDEVIGRANRSDFGLAAGVFTADLKTAHGVIAKLKAGTCWINSYNLTPVEMPFGGMKQSGLGRENSPHAIEHYSQIKSVYVEMGEIENPYSP